jgi:hypothetical protein
MIFRKSSKIRDLESKITKLSALCAELAAEQRSINELLIAQRGAERASHELASAQALSEIIASERMIFLEGDLESASREIISRALAQRESKIPCGGIDFGIMICEIADISFLIIADERRVIMGARRNRFIAERICELMIGDAEDLADEMEGDGDAERIARALSDASQEAEIRVWLLTARDCGDLEGEII